MLYRANLLLFAGLVAASIAVFQAVHAPTLADEVFGSTERIQLESVEGHIVRQPDVSEIDQRLTIEIPLPEVNVAANAGATNQVQPHTIWIRTKTPVYPVWRAGDHITISCNLNKPKAFDGFAYDRFLSRYHIAGECSFAQLQLRWHTPSPYSRLIDAKLWIEDRLQRTVPQPEASLIQGIVFGEMRALPKPLAEAFRTTGTTHLLVISGSNIALIIAWMNAVFARFTSRRNTVLLVMGFIAVYVAFTGFQPSATRAAVFGSTMLVATWLGRPDQALRALLYTGICMTLWNPLLPVIDAGFQLSFLASLGMILWSEWVASRITWIPKALGVREGVSATIAATVITMPLITTQFGQLSIIGPLANLFLVPLMSAFLSLGILQSVIAGLSIHVGLVTGTVFTFFLRLCIEMVRIASAPEWAAIEVTTIPQWISPTSYGFLAILVLSKLLYAKHTKHAA